MKEIIPFLALAENVIVIYIYKTRVVLVVPLNVIGCLVEWHCCDLQEDEVSVALVAVRALQQVFTRFLSTGEMFIAHMPTKEEGNDIEVLSQEKNGSQQTAFFHPLMINCL